MGKSLYNHFSLLLFSPWLIMLCLLLSNYRLQAIDPCSPACPLPSPNCRPSPLVGSGGDAGARRSSCLFQEQVFVYFSASIRRSNLPESNLGTRTGCIAGDWAESVPTQRLGKEVSNGSRCFCLFFWAREEKLTCTCASLTLWRTSENVMRHTQNGV